MELFTVANDTAVPAGTFFTTSLDNMQTRGEPNKVITGRLVVDLNTRIVSVDGTLVNLTDKERAIFELLSLRKGATVTKEMFLKHLYHGTDEPEMKIIDVFICKLRKKLAQATGGEHHIDTLWGRGYMLRDPAADMSTSVRKAMRDTPAMSSQ
jgi:two-component system, cell cycle response regulator CtrA